MSDDRQERHSGDPKSAAYGGKQKKDGGGGKFSSGKLGEENDAMALDPRDPNYDPDEAGGPSVPKSQQTWFDKVVRGEIEIASVYEDDQVIAVEEQNAPQAPVHILVFPKQRITKLKNATEDHKQALGHLMLACSKVCRMQKLSDYRMVMNDGTGAGDKVNYLHLHILAGRPLSWPPG
jgi:histidine triad (HIT) family protein